MNVAYIRTVQWDLVYPTTSVVMNVSDEPGVCEYVRTCEVNVAYIRTVQWDLVYPTTPVVHECVR